MSASRRKFPSSGVLFCKNLLTLTRRQIVGWKRKEGVNMKKRMFILIFLLVLLFAAACCAGKKPQPDPAPVPFSESPCVGLKVKYIYGKNERYNLKLSAEKKLIRFLILKMFLMPLRHLTTSF